jgi:hypothetical protein
MAHNIGNISNTIFPGLVAWLLRHCRVHRMPPWIGNNGMHGGNKISMKNFRTSFVL